MKRDNKLLLDGYHTFIPSSAHLRFNEPRIKCVCVCTDKISRSMIAINPIALAHPVFHACQISHFGDSFGCIPLNCLNNRQVEIQSRLTHLRIICQLPGGRDVTLQIFLFVAGTCYLRSNSLLLVLLKKSAVNAESHWEAPLVIKSCLSF